MVLVRPKRGADVQTPNRTTTRDCVDKYTVLLMLNMNARVFAHAQNANRTIIPNERTHRREMCSEEREREEDALRKDNNSAK